MIPDVNMLTLCKNSINTTAHTRDLLREEGIAVEAAQMLIKREYQAIIE